VVAPHLRPFRLVGVGEIVHEAGEQVTFRDHHVDRHANAERFVQFAQAQAQGCRVRRALLGEIQQIDDRKREQGAIDRPPRRAFFKQCKKPLPRLLVGFRIGFVRGVATRRVDQHGLVG